MQNCLNDINSSLPRRDLLVQGAQIPSLVRELDPTCHSQKFPHAKNKTWCSHINKYFFFKKKKSAKKLQRKKFAKKAVCQSKNLTGHIFGTLNVLFYFCFFFLYNFLNFSTFFANIQYDFNKKKKMFFKKRPSGNQESVCFISSGYSLNR